MGKILLKIAFWAQLVLQLVCWSVFLLNGISYIVNTILWRQSSSDGNALFLVVISFALYELISSAGILIFALLALMIKSSTYQPLHNEMTAFDRSLKFVVAGGWGVFFVLVLLFFARIIGQWFWILPVIWIAYAILCDVLLIILNAKEKTKKGGMSHET